uniref:Uncharacterized protein n=1 Tax=Lygus hesperus TaxID=30085 RepID=A0A146LI74_LYGHE
MNRDCSVNFFYYFAPDAVVAAVAFQCCWMVYSDYPVLVAALATVAAAVVAGAAAVGTGPPRMASPFPLLQLAPCDFVDPTLVVPADHNLPGSIPPEGVKRSLIPTVWLITLHYHLKPFTIAYSL